MCIYTHETVQSVYIIIWHIQAFRNAIKYLYQNTNASEAVLWQHCNNSMVMFNGNSLSRGEKEGILTPVKLKP